MGRPYLLTKSKYCKGLNCEKALYYSVFHKDLATPPGPSQQLRFDEGNEVGELAHSKFPGGVLIAEDHTKLEDAARKTKEIIEDPSVPAIFEATFIFDEVLCRVDVLKRNADNSWDIYEVKSTKEVKEEHEDDVAIQLWVLTKLGLAIKNVFLLHINPEFISPNWDDFFFAADLTDVARAKHLKEVDSIVRKQKSILAQNETPDVRLGSHCNTPYPCEFKEHCWKDIPKGSTLELYRSRKKYEIFYEKFEFLHEIDPKQIKLTDFQIRQWTAAQQEEPVVDLESIRREIHSLQFPLYFFDFETVAPAIPFLDGMASYQRLPVQWSCHVMTSPESEISHFEYLIDPARKEDPRVSCVKSLHQLFAPGFGTVIAYHASFEKGVLRELAEMVPESSALLLEVMEHFWDLETIFQKYYYHKDLKGSCSIKSVLPHFAPKLDYKDLFIQDGSSSEAWLNKLCRNEIDDISVRSDLLEYCKRDTQAMIVIFERLIQLFDSFNWQSALPKT
ncbi:MAG: hypothetical protein COV44_08950 [Deltaproteobacteria bacterium CG11_big_fil_rev_8_21_14_0_20_45_16]|nr:MAG: hypothetical protein COV44_08950 [Deltaproteobacteria bacterium CG11_big_fil_rev_8_21_14_0_20_45_16]